MATFPKIPASAKASRFPPPTEGSHVCICSPIVYLGLQEGRFGQKREVYLAFEVTDESNSWVGKDGPHTEPKRISTTCTVTLSEKAKLRGYVEGVIGRRLTDAELREARPRRPADRQGVPGARRARREQRQHVRQHLEHFAAAEVDAGTGRRKPNGSVTRRTSTTRRRGRSCRSGCRRKSPSASRPSNSAMRQRQPSRLRRPRRSTTTSRSKGAVRAFADFGILLPPGAAGETSVACPQCSASAQEAAREVPLGARREAVLVLAITAAGAARSRPASSGNRRRASPSAGRSR